MAENQIKDPVDKKWGMFTQLVGLFDTKGKATMTTILVLAIIYLVYARNADKDKMYGMVIEEVRKQVPKEVSKQVAPAVADADSNKKTLAEYGGKLDTVLTSVKSTINKLNKKSDK